MLCLVLYRRSAGMGDRARRLGFGVALLDWADDTEKGCKWDVLGQVKHPSSLLLCL